MDEPLDIILLIIGFLSVIIAAYFVTKFVGARMIQGGTGGKYLKIVDRLILGSDKSICLIQAGKRFYLVGVSNHHVECLAEIGEQDLNPLELKQSTFNGLLNKYMIDQRSTDKEQGSSIDKIKEKLERRKESLKKL